MRRFTLFVFAALLAVGWADAQNEALMRFAGNIHQFNSIFPQEKVYLQFDNTSYYSGEVIWFKAFVVNASTLNRAESKVLYVDLIAPDGVLLKREKLKIVAGQADGSLPLLDGSTGQARDKRGILGYPSGFYEVRAYTNYMLNFSPDAIFTRVFAVYENPKQDGNYYGENPTIRLTNPDTWEQRPKAEKLDKINCSFYPEGGHLIMGKPCRVAFKVTDDTGFGIDATGTLESAGITFSTVHDGMGWFTFTPRERRNQVRITVDGKSHSFSLPQAEQTGVALTVDQCGTDSIGLKIDCSPNISGTTLGMTMTCRGELVEFLSFETGSGPIESVIPMRGIPEGVCRIKIFDSDGNIYASRSVYHSSQEIRPPVLEFQTNKDRYEPFERVELNFSLKDSRGNPFRDRFCLSVRDVRGQANSLADDLRTSMLLSSDLKGFIENPSWYFDSDAPEREQALDLLMLVQGWERYDWLTMTGQQEFSERHRIERNLTLNGWVLNSSGRGVLDGVEVTASLVPTDKTLTESYTYVTDSSGYFGFDIGTEFFDKAKFTIAAHAKRKRILGTDARIRFDRSILPPLRAYEPQELQFHSLSGTVSKSGNKQNEADDGLPMVINVDLGLLLPDVDIDEKRMFIDYFTFKAFDVAKDVEVELDQGEYSTDLLGYLLDKGYVVEYNTDSGTIDNINGFPTFMYIHDQNNYLNVGIFESPAYLDSKDIKSILIYDPPIYRVNTYELAPLWTKKTMATPADIMGTDQMYERVYMVDILIKEPHELSTKKELYNINRRTTTVDGYSRQYEFYAPEYPDGPVLGDVDYRRTLYWNPNVITDDEGKAKVEFYNNSITRHFDISAAGMTASGIPYILDEKF